MLGYDDMLAAGGDRPHRSLTRLRLLASSNQSEHDRWRRRAQVVQQIHVFTRLAERAHALTALTRWMGTLAGAMSERWTDATTPPPPVFPAFASAVA